MVMYSSAFILDTTQIHVALYRCYVCFFVFFVSFCVCVCVCVCDENCPISLVYLRIVCLVFVRDFCGRTPVHFAASCGHLSIVELLLQFGGSPSTPDKHGYTPIHWAAYNG